MRRREDVHPREFHPPPHGSKDSVTRAAKAPPALNARANDPPTGAELLQDHVRRRPDPIARETVPGHGSEREPLTRHFIAQSDGKIADGSCRPFRPRQYSSAARIFRTYPVNNIMYKVGTSIPSSCIYFPLWVTGDGSTTFERDPRHRIVQFRSRLNSIDPGKNPAFCPRQYSNVATAKPRLIAESVWRRAIKTKRNECVHIPLAKKAVRTNSSNYESDMDALQKDPRRTIATSERDSESELPVVNHVVIAHDDLSQADGNSQPESEQSPQTLCLVSEAQYEESYSQTIHPSESQMDVLVLPKGEKEVVTSGIGETLT